MSQILDGKIIYGDMSRDAKGGTELMMEDFGMSRFTK